MTLMMMMSDEVEGGVSARDLNVKTVGLLTAGFWLQGATR
jgi:hypothetical protein